MGFDDNCLGSHAQYLRVSEEKPLTFIPDSVSFEAAAASMEGAHYARNGMNKVSLNAGDEVVVYGATGAIGSAAVPLLKQMGIQVTAVAAQQHHETVTALGADRVLDYIQEDWRRALAGERFPFVFDAVGKSSFGACKQVLDDHGVYISSELGRGGQNIGYAVAAPLMRGPKVRFPLPTDIPKSLELVTSLLATGKFNPLIDRTYPLAEIRDAYEYVASGQKIGNVMLSFD